MLFSQLKTLNNKLIKINKMFMIKG